MSTVSLDALSAADAAGFLAALGGIYEHSPWVAEAALARRPFARLNDLHEAMRAALHAADDTRKRVVLNAHPDLAGTLTADSTREQSSAGLDRLNEREFETFQRLNSAYRDKFGFPFIVCVRRHTKDSIFAQFARRLRNDLATEYDTALAEVGRIAALRHGANGPMLRAGQTFAIFE